MLYLCERERWSAFPSVLFPCHLAHSCVFGKISFCNPNCCASLLWINEKILALCESGPCCGGDDGYSVQNPEYPAPWQEFPGVIPNPELQLPWQNCLLDLRPTRKIALVYEIILRKEMQPGEQVKSFKFYRVTLIAGVYRCAPLLQINTAGNSLTSKGESTLKSVCFCPSRSHPGRR